MNNKNLIRTWLLAALSSLLLASCGGGDVAGVGSGGTSGTGGNDGKSYVAGVVTQEGRDLLVNGVRIDLPSGVPVSNVHDGAQVKLSDIKPGMMIEVDASRIIKQGGKEVVQALSIRVNSQVQGLVFSVDVDGDGHGDCNSYERQLPEDLRQCDMDISGASEPDRHPSFSALGMKVYVTPTTVFSDDLQGGLQDLKKFLDVVEVHGYLDVSSNSLIATRISKRDLFKTEFFFLQGVPNNPSVNEFLIANVPIQFQSANWMEMYKVTLARLKSAVVNVKFSIPPQLLALGDGGRLPPLDSQWSYLKDVQATVSLNVPEFSGDARESIVDGLVTKVGKRQDADGVDDAFYFVVNNVEVDWRGYASKCGKCAMLVVGDRVKVRGFLSGGKLLPTLIEVAQENGDTSGAGEGVADEPFASPDQPAP